MLAKKAVSIQRELLTTIFHGKAGYTGGALGSVDILTALYYGVMRIDPANSAWKDRDCFVMSKGYHGVPDAAMLDSAMKQWTNAQGAFHEKRSVLS